LSLGSIAPVNAAHVRRVSQRDASVARWRLSEELHTRGLGDVAVNIGREYAIVFGMLSSCTEPVLVRPNQASKSPGSSSSWTRFRSTNETESGETCSTLLSPSRAESGPSLRQAHYLR